MRSILLFTFFLLFSKSLLLSQKDKRVYLDQFMDTCLIDVAKFYVVDERNDKGLSAHKIYNIDGSLSLVFSYVLDSKELVVLQGPRYSYFDNGQLCDSTNFYNNQQNGIFLEYYENGQLKRQGTYVLDRLHDTLETYYESGAKKRFDIYKNGVLVKGELVDEKGNLQKYEDYEIGSTFPGGQEEMMKFIVDKMVFPEEALDYGIEGKVYLGFSVDTSGVIKKIKVLHSISPILSKAAIEVIEMMPNWIPGKIDGEKRMTYFTLPINFDLGGSSDSYVSELSENYFWNGETLLIDPMSNNKIKVYKKPKNEIYYREIGSSVTKSVVLSKMELIKFRYLKFDSEASCNQWFQLYNDTMILMIKKKKH